ncbi:MAG: DUF1194 domain-containing protein [Pseudomonadota bacterium]
MKRLKWIGLGLWAIALATTPAWSQQAANVDLELVLAIDVSSSVDGNEFDLQTKGLAEAFRHPAVHNAVRALGGIGIAVAVVQWSGEGEQEIVVDWTRVADSATANALARQIDNAPRAISGGQTSIGDALRYSLELFEGNGYQGRRRVIDVSGDGRANAGADPSLLRDLAIFQGVTVNGLTILNEEPFVDSYYQYNVIGGDGAFQMSADDFEDFALVILKKLVREITVPFSQLDLEQQARAAVVRPSPGGGASAP